MKSAKVSKMLQQPNLQNMHDKCLCTTEVMKHQARERRQNAIYQKIDTPKMNEQKCPNEGIELPILGEFWIASVSPSE